MTIYALEKNACNIIEAYQGFNLLKEGSKKDKIFFFGLIISYVIATAAVFIFNIFVKNFIFWIVSLISWIGVLIAIYSFQQHILKRETKVYIKGATKESNFLNYFEQKLETHGINRDKYNLYIDYFTNQLNFKRMYKINALALYITIIVCPIMISFFTKGREVEALGFSIAGIFIIPGLIFFTNWYIHRKEYTYEGIINYLRLGLLLERK